MDYDAWVTSGTRHTCECGSFWWDSDGGPCCDRCEDCKELFDVDDLNENCICEDCEAELEEDEE